MKYFPHECPDDPEVMGRALFLQEEEREWQIAAVANGIAKAFKGGKK